VDWKAKLPAPLSGIQRYGLAVLSVSVALGGALLLERFGFRDVEVPLFLFAVALSAWYGGTGAAALALVLSCVGFDYFFVQPIHSFEVSSSDLPYFIVFAMFASLVTWFSAVRRRVERDLRQARDELKIDFRPRYDRRHHLLESGSSGVVWMDGRASSWQALSRVIAHRLSGADRADSRGTAAFRALGR